MFVSDYCIWVQNTKCTEKLDDFHSALGCGMNCKIRCMCSWRGTLGFCYHDITAFTQSGSLIPSREVQHKLLQNTQLPSTSLHHWGTSSLNRIKIATTQRHLQPCWEPQSPTLQRTLLKLAPFLLLEEFGLTLHKGSFRDAIALWYGWQPLHTLGHMCLWPNFCVEHVLSCLKGSFPTKWHNKVRDLTHSKFDDQSLQWCMHRTNSDFQPRKKKASGLRLELCLSLLALMRKSWFVAKDIQYDEQQYTPKSVHLLLAGLRLLHVLEKLNVPKLL